MPRFLLAKYCYIVISVTSLSARKLPQVKKLKKKVNKIRAFR